MVCELLTRHGHVLRWIHRRRADESRLRMRDRARLLAVIDRCVRCVESRRRLLHRAAVQHYDELATITAPAGWRIA
jgi:hypothetical protein